MGSLLIGLRMYQPRYNQIFTLGWLKELIENGGDVPNQI